MASVWQYLAHDGCKVSGHLVYACRQYGVFAAVDGADSWFETVECSNSEWIGRCSFHDINDAIAYCKELTGLKIGDKVSFSRTVHGRKDKHVTMRGELLYASPLGLYKVVDVPDAWFAVVGESPDSWDKLIELKTFDDRDEAISYCNNLEMREVGKMAKSRAQKIVELPVEAERTGLRLQLQELETTLNQHFLERGDLIYLMQLSLLSGVGLIQFGKPGTAKSAIVRAFSSAIQGNFYQRTLDPATRKEELFGSLDVLALREGKYQVNRAGSLTEAHVAFVDEIYRGSAGIRDSLLTLANEGVVYDGYDQIEAPLLTLFGASNFLPRSDYDAAFHDRFIAYPVLPLQDKKNIKLAALMQVDVAVQVTIAPESIWDARKDINEIACSPELIDTLLLLETRLKEAEEILISDRRRRLIVKLARTAAWLRGGAGAVVAQEDFVRFLPYLTWETTAQVDVVKELVKSTFRDQVSVLLEKHLPTLNIVENFIKQDKKDNLKSRNPQSWAAQVQDGLRSLEEMEKAVDSLDYHPEIKRFLVKVDAAKSALSSSFEEYLENMDNW